MRIGVVLKLMLLQHLSFRSFGSSRTWQSPAVRPNLYAVKVNHDKLRIMSSNCAMGYFRTRHRCHVLSGMCLFRQDQAMRPSRMVPAELVSAREGTRAVVSSGRHFPARLSSWTFPQGCFFRRLAQAERSADVLDLARSRKGVGQAGIPASWGAGVAPRSLRPLRTVRLRSFLQESLGSNPPEA